MLYRLFLSFKTFLYLNDTKKSIVYLQTLEVGVVVFM